RVLITDIPDVNHKEYSKKNRQVQKTICLLVKDDQFIQIWNQNTVKVNWDALQKLYGRSSLNTKLFLLRKLN
ncbi:hypothetical protein XELAEV_18022422mg, partial [Xenopus laevis]